MPILVTTVFAIQCGAPSANRTDYVGEYVLTPTSAASERFANFLILRGDQTAVEIRYVRETGQVQTRTTKWYLDQGQNGTSIVVGDFSHPVEGSGKSIRLGVNDDLGIHYEKIQ